MVQPNPVSHPLRVLARHPFLHLLVPPPVFRRCVHFLSFLHAIFVVFLDFFLSPPYNEDTTSGLLTIILWPRIWLIPGLLLEVSSSFDQIEDPSELATCVATIAGSHDSDQKATDTVILRT